MKKYILRVEEKDINNFVAVLNNEVFPAITAIVGELKTLNITDNYKERLSEVLVGEYSYITNYYKGLLEEDAAKFVTPLAKGQLLNQLEPTINELRQRVKDATKGFRNKMIGGIAIGKPEVLKYFELNEEGNPYLTDDNNAYINNKFTIYVTSELGASFHKAHIEFVRAANEIYSILEKNHIKSTMWQLYDENYETKELTPIKIDYDKALEFANDYEEMRKDNDNTPLISKPREFNSFKDLNTNKECLDKRVNPETY